MNITERKKGVTKTGRKYPPEHYTREECLAVIAACPDTWAGRRNRVLITLLWRSGLRLAEALALEPQNIDFQYQTIRVLHGKGDKARTVGMDAREATALREWLNERGDFPPHTPVVCTRRGGPIHQAYVRALLPGLAKKAGVKKRVHAHGFRHTFAVELMREGVRIKDIQVLLGHASLQVTSVYLASLSPEEAIEAIRGREW